MTEKKELICICCPIGCRLAAELEGKTVQSVTGNACRRGESYAREELTSPTRVLTTTVRLYDTDEMIPVKSASPLPKEKLLDCMNRLKSIHPHSPVGIGDVILENIEDTGISILATKNSKGVALE